MEASKELYLSQKLGIKPKRYKYPTPPISYLSTLMRDISLLGINLDLPEFISITDLSWSQYELLEKLTAQKRTTDIINYFNNLD